LAEKERRVISARTRDALHAAKARGQVLGRNGAERLAPTYKAQVIARAKSVIATAKKGDMTAARLVLERLAPARKGRPVTFSLPKDVDAAVFPAVLRAVAEGQLTPQEGQGIAGLLEARRKAIELAEVEARIRALEERNGR